MARAELLEFEGADAVRRRMLQRAISANLPGVSNGQTLRNFVDLFAEDMQTQHNRNMFAMANGVPSLASGPYLDLIGESNFALVRNGAIPAFVQLSDRNIVFFVQSGQLTDYLPVAFNGRSNIPQGTVIHDGKGNVYVTTADVYVSANETQAFVPAEAQTPGRSRNVPANALRTHDLDQRLSVTNRFDISTGTDVESDQNYRFRVMHAHLASQGGNRAALELAVSSVPGISQFRIRENFNGPGTIEILVVPTGNRLSPSVKRQAEAAAEASQPGASIVVVREPNYLDYEVGLKIVRRNTLDGTTSMVRRAAVDATMSFMNGVPLGGRFDTSQMMSVIRNSLSRFGVADVTVLCFLLNQEAVRPGVITLARRDLLVPTPFDSEPVKVSVA